MASKYDALSGWLQAHADDGLELSFDEIERILGAELPKSGRKYPAFWSTGNRVGRVLERVGWKASLRSKRGTVLFKQVSGPPVPSGRPPAKAKVPRRRSKTAMIPRDSARPVHPATAGSAYRPDLILIGCVKEKRAGRHLARELYTSQLFRRRRAYAESLATPWYILSAKYGLVEPDRVIDSYDLSLKDLPAHERRAWSEKVFRDLEQKAGSLNGKVIEIHAGQEYFGNGLEEALGKRGAVVRVPTRGLPQGKQLAFYDCLTESLSRTTDRCGPGLLVLSLTRDFTDGRFDLSARKGAPRAGWEAMPEFVVAKGLKALWGGDDRLRVFLTLVAAMDRARDADRLWSLAGDLYEKEPWVFEPTEVLRRGVEELRDILVESGVSQRHDVDTRAWYRIAQALVAPQAPHSIQKAVREGRGHASDLLRDVRSRDDAGRPWFPLLRGPKLSTMWVRLLVAPGGAQIDGLREVPVAVDVHVRRASENLGVIDHTDGGGKQLRLRIQNAWRRWDRCATGPRAVAGTSAAIDPALWFLGKWGCSFCERWEKKSPVSLACLWCRKRT